MNFPLLWNTTKQETKREVIGEVRQSVQCFRTDGWILSHPIVLDTSSSTSHWYTSDSI